MGMIEKFADLNRLKTRVDEDGTTIIPGKIGHIYEYDGETLGVMIMPNPPRKQYWGVSRTVFLANKFTILQNGDGEGAAQFDPNNRVQVKLAIKAAKIKRKRLMSPAQAEVLDRARKRSPLMRKWQARAQNASQPPK